MDSMRIETKFMTGIISKLAGSVIKKKLGCNIDIRLNRLNADVVDGKTQVHLDLDAELTKDELVKLLKSIGLD